MICISETFDKGGKENGGLSRWPLIGGLTTTVRDNQTSSLEQMNMPLYIDVGGLSVNLSQFGNFLV
jgi:hypothetical protein